VRRATELAEAEREDQFRPVVAGTVTSVESGSGRPWLNVELHNIGSGAAVSLDMTAE
jgi:hypothetical protein